MINYPDNYLKVYGYLFYMTCPNMEINPFYNVSETDREFLVNKELETNISEEDDYIKPALDFCKSLYETKTAKLVRQFGILLDKLGDYVETTPIQHGRDGNLTSLIASAKNVAEIKSSYKELERDLLAEQKASVRGGAALAYDQS